MSIIRLNLPSPPTVAFLKPEPLLLPVTSIQLLFPAIKTSLKPLNCTKLPSILPSDHTGQKIHPPQYPLSRTLQSLCSLKPFILPQHVPIFVGWLCSLASVVSLSKIVPKVGKFSAGLTNINVLMLRDEGLVLGALLLVRSVASYWQQAFLWEAAVNAAYWLRVYVFERVLERDLAFFEDGGAISAGDIAYRITAEAADVSDTMYAVLNTIVPSTLQLSAMVAQMLIISPALSLISAVVIPILVLVIAHLGEKLKEISKKAHMSVAALSAYLNEVLPAILFVKANNSEQCESARFRRLAHTNLSEQLKKRKMKALIPQITQIVYFGGLFIFCAGSLLVSSGSFDGCSMVSFVTSLSFLVEPIQPLRSCLKFSI